MGSAAGLTEREIERLIEAASKNRRGHRDVEAGVVRHKGPEHNLHRLVYSAKEILS
jgi:hypothetical protein